MHGALHFITPALLLLESVAFPHAILIVTSLNLALIFVPVLLISVPFLGTAFRGAFAQYLCDSDTIFLCIACSESCCENFFLYRDENRAIHIADLSEILL